MKAVLWSRGEVPPAARGLVADIERLYGRICWYKAFPEDIPRDAAALGWTAAEVQSAFARARAGVEPRFDWQIAYLAKLDAIEASMTAAHPRIAPTGVRIALSPEASRADCAATLAALEAEGAAELAAAHASPARARLRR